MGQRNKEIDEQAAIWAAKIAGGNLTPGEQACFDTWYAADTRHVGAFARSQAILLRVGRLHAIGADALRAAIADAPEETVPPELQSDAGVLQCRDINSDDGWTRRRLIATGGLAVSFAAIGVVGTALWNDVSPTAPTPSDTQFFSTRIGETRTVQLSDGSVVTLNTNSKIAVSYTKAARNVHLELGEALFNVAKNKARPFIVAAADTTVRAVGTSFTVRALPQEPVRVLVKEGIVEVTNRSVKATRAVRATAKTQAVVADNAPIALRMLPQTQVERNLAWQFGQISFENETLSRAAEEFARYSDKKIAVDPGIAERTITGMYAANDPVGFAKAAAAVLDLHVEVKSNEVWIVR